VCSSDLNTKLPPTGPWSFVGYEAMASSGDARFQVIDATATPDEMLVATKEHLKQRLAEMEHGLLTDL